MKKKFIFLTMMLLTLMGGVKWNVLNAQETTITIGSGGEKSIITPFDMYNSYGICQIVYTPEDINNYGDANIVGFALKFYGVTNGDMQLMEGASGVTRNFRIYLQNTDMTSLSSYTPVSGSTLCYEGSKTLVNDNWTSFEFTESFPYEGESILVTIVDNSGYSAGSAWYTWYVDNINDKCVSGSPAASFDASYSYTLSESHYIPYSQLTFEASGPKVTIEAPADIYSDQTATLTATATGFDGDVEYNWSSNEVIVGTGATYTFDPSAEGIYTFTCTATDANNEASASVTINVTERPTLVLSVSADDTEIYSDETTRLYANVQYGSGEYTYSWSLNEKIVGTEATYTFTPSATGEYTFSCTVTDSEGETATASTTVKVTERPESPFAGKQFRVKVGYSQYHTGKYLNVSSYTMSNTNTSNVATSNIADNSMQIFAVEEADNGYYYLRTIDGYYIECGAFNTWNVDCYQQSPNSPLQFDYTNSTYFYMRDTKKSGNNYFKIDSDGRVYCNADYNAAAIWVLEEVLPEAPDAPTLSANAISVTAVQLSWNAVLGADTYTVYEGTNVIAENITGTNYTHEGLTASTTYNYTVTATNEIGTSEASNTATATTWAPAPEAAPANLQATSVTHNSVTLTWDAVDDATYYEIYKDGSYLSYTNTTTYTVTALSAETSYSFTVKAGNNSGTSPKSEALSVTTEQFIGCTIVFKLYDSYGDGWNTANMTITYGGKIETLEFENGAETTYEREFLSGSEVTLCYNKNSNSWVYENKFTIMYEDGEVIWERAGSDYGGDLSDKECYDFTVKSILPSPENLVIVEGENNRLYPGETTTISWDALEGAVSYNVYVNDVKFNTEAIEGLSYELVNLPYGMNTIAVAAVYADDSESGMSNTVTVQMAGTFPLTIKVQDMNGNAVANASLTIEGYDEYYEYRTYEGITYNNGEWYKADMPLLYESYPYSIYVSAEPFEEQYSYFYESETENGVAFTHTIEMQLPTIDAETEKESYDANEDIVIFWNAVDSEYLQGYNVYVNDEETPRNTELLTTAIYTLEGGLAESGSIAVTAVYEGYGESAKNYTYVNFNKYVKLSGTVTDGTNPIAGAEVVAQAYVWGWIVGTQTTITDAEGAFEFEVLPNYDYSVSVSKYGYSSYTSSENYDAVVDNDIILDAIVLTANADVEFAVEATEENGNVTVTWEAPEGATQYNVFRKDATEAVVKLADNVTETMYEDKDWATLENGQYTYGVSAFVGGGSETLLNESFENNGTNIPTGWVASSNFVITNGHNNTENGAYAINIMAIGSGSSTKTLKSPAITIDGSAQLSFYYKNFNEMHSYYGNMNIKVESDGETKNIYGISSTYDINDFQQVTLSLNEYMGKTVNIIFETVTFLYSTFVIDDIVVSVSSSPVESSINWASALTKNDANVFTGAGEWTSVDNWSNGVPADGANVFIEGDVTIASNVNVNNMTINGGSVTINNAASLIVEGTLVNEAAENLVINDGAQIFQNNEEISATFVMNINNWTENENAWQFIASPLLGASVFSHATGNYDLFKYDGNADLEWYNHKLHAAGFGSTFEQGVGYLASHETANTIVMTGTLNNKNTHTWNSNSFTYDYEGDKDVANFNLLGNPFTFNMKWSEVVSTDLVNGYAYLNEDGGYETAVDGEIAVGDAFFVKAKSADAQMSYGVRGAKAEQSEYINLIASGKAGRDNVIINLAGKQEGFTKMQNFNESIATVYVAEDNTRYGIYNCNSDIEEVVVSFNAKDMGDYTIAAVTEGSFSSVVLVDLFTGVETNLMTSGYTFAAKSGDNAERFVVRFSYSQDSADFSNFVYQSGEDLIIMAEGAVQIVDMLGRVVYYSEVATDVTRVNVSNFDNAAYIVRVVNGEGVKTQKVVIY